MLLVTVQGTVCWALAIVDTVQVSGHPRLYLWKLLCTLYFLCSVNPHAWGPYIKQNGHQIIRSTLHYQCTDSTNALVLTQSVSWLIGLTCAPVRSQKCDRVRLMCHSQLLPAVGPGQRACGAGSAPRSGGQTCDRVPLNRDSGHGSGNSHK